MKAKHILVTSGVVLGGVWLSSGAGALTYQDTVDVEFTFNPLLTLSLSSAALTISDLAPGTAAASDPINITVKTSSILGYDLSAKVGTSSNNSNALIHSESSGNTFSSLATNASLALGSITAGYWGYSTDGTNYSGLPAYGSNAKTIHTLGQNTSDSGDVTSFKIGAKASDGMLAGSYSNTINFMAVSKVDTSTP